MTSRTVKVEVQLPRGIVEFARDLLEFSAEDRTVEEFLGLELAGEIRSILDDLPCTWFDKGKLAKKYGLDKE